MTQVFETFTILQRDRRDKLVYNKPFINKEREMMKRSSWYKNLRKTLENADKDSFESGLVWYEKANSFANQLSAAYKVELDVSAQVIAALSPAVRWERNLEDAKAIVESYYHRGWIGCQPVKVTTYGQNKSKALKILNKEITLTPKTGLKTYNFFNNILNPNDESFVTIDRHAFSILLGPLAKRGSVVLTPSQYERASKVYKFVAKERGLTPNQIQAITWEAYRKTL